MAAPESMMTMLHEMQAQKLLEILRQGYMVVGTTVDEEGNESEITQPLTPAFFQAVSKFLKDNDITCAPDADSDVGKLDEERRKRMDERRSRREKRLATAVTKNELVEAGGSPLVGLDPLLMQ